MTDKAAPAPEKVEANPPSPEEDLFEDFALPEGEWEPPYLGFNFKALF
jgi:hypothetical protein